VSPADEFPSHPPINVTGDVGMVLPDALVANGVRSGTGLETDPWVISDWTISSGGATAIRLSAITGYILLRDLQIETDNQLGPVVGIVLAQASHVRLERITFRGTGQPLSVTGGEVSASELEIQSEGEGTCIRLEQATATLTGIVFNDSCTLGSIGAIGGNTTLRSITATGQGAGIGAVHPASFTIEDSTIDIGRNPLPADGSVPGADGILVILGQHSKVTLSNVELRRAQSNCLRIQTDQSTDADVRLTDVHVEDCGRDDSGTGLAIERGSSKTIKASGLTVLNNPIGIRSFRDGLDIEKSLIQGNAIGLWARAFDDEPSQAPSMNVQSTTFSRNGIDARADGQASIHVAASYGASNTQGNVDQTAREQDPPVQPINVPRKQTPALSLALVALCLLIVGARRRNRGGALVVILLCLVPATVAQVALGGQGDSFEVIYVKQELRGAAVIHSKTMILNESNVQVGVQIPPSATIALFQVETDNTQTIQQDLPTGFSTIDLTALGVNVSQAKMARTFVSYTIVADRVPIQPQPGTTSFRIFVETASDGYAYLPGVPLAFIPRETESDLFRSGNLTTADAGNLHMTLQHERMRPLTAQFGTGIVLGGFAMYLIGKYRAPWRPKRIR
jgi:hypothetical protein